MLEPEHSAASGILTVRSYLTLTYFGLEGHRDHIFRKSITVNVTLVKTGIALCRAQNMFGLAHQENDRPGLEFHSRLNHSQGEDRSRERVYLR